MKALTLLLSGLVNFTIFFSSCGVEKFNLPEEETTTDSNQETPPEKSPTTLPEELPPQTQIEVEVTVKVNPKENIEVQKEYPEKLREGLGMDQVLAIIGMPDKVSDRDTGGAVWYYELESGVCGESQYFSNCAVWFDEDNLLEAESNIHLDFIDYLNWD